MRYLFLCTVVIVLSTSCKKDASAGKLVEIYQLRTYQPVSGKCQVDAATAVLQDTAAIGNSDIVIYSKSDYTFEFTTAGFAKIKAFNAGMPFALTVDKQVIYYGFYIPPFISSSCDHSLTMNNLFSGQNKMTVNLGYPGTVPGTTIDDQRNNSKLIAALSAQGKLR